MNRWVTFPQKKNHDKKSIHNFLSLLFFSHDQLEHIVDRVVAEADTNEDGFISFEEFQEAISKLDVEQKMAFIGFK